MECAAPILACMEAPEDKLDFPWIMIFPLVPHLPRWVAWERRTTATVGHTKNFTYRYHR